jgi:hypothetical protein
LIQKPSPIHVFGSFSGKEKCQASFWVGEMKGEQLPAHGSVWKAKLDVALDALLDRLTDCSLTGLS